MAFKPKKTGHGLSQPHMTGMKRRRGRSGRMSRTGGRRPKR